MSPTQRFRAPKGKGTISPSTSAGILSRLEQANAVFARSYPGDSADAQPVHTIYGGANLFKRDSAVKLGSLALNALNQYAPNWRVFAKVFELPGHERIELQPATWEHLGDDLVDPEFEMARTIYQLLCQRLRHGAVQDQRIDFEDGYGPRPDDEEDSDAERAAIELAAAIEGKTCPPFIGIRIKPLNNELSQRSIRTLDIFLSSFLKTGQTLPTNFIVTLPKVTIPEQVTALVELFEAFEEANGLSCGTLKMELMVETTQSIINANGSIALRQFVKSGAGRIRGMHFGTYDYTAASGVVATHQAMNHPVCYFAREMMVTALSGTGIWLSDGATVQMPIAPFKDKPGATLSESQLAANERAVHEAWLIAYKNVMESLRLGLYQGWDLHPAQMVSRYAACFTFFRTGMGPTSKRLKTFMEKAAQATLSGNDFDDAATGQGLLNFMIKAIDSGAASEEEVQKLTGLSLEEIRTRSFVQIIEGRRQQK